jgi:cytochrome c-type biogenesis protein
MTFASTLFALVAGMLSSLSPCVLPILPLVFGAAVYQHRYGAVALALGLALSFTAAGLFIATIGFKLGLDAGLFRTIGAILLIAIGLVLVLPGFEARFAAAMATVSNWGNRQMQDVEGHGFWGQFGLGALLGAVWSPCVGPTLGAASLAAAQGKNLGSVTLTMLAFGIGAAIPLLLLGLASRDLLVRWRGRLASAAKQGKLILGFFVIVTGVGVLSGLDKELETVLVQHSPDWLTNLTVKF